MSNGINLIGIVDADGVVHKIDHAGLANNPTIPVIDAYLSTNGKLADAGVVGTALQTLDLVEKPNGIVAETWSNMLNHLLIPVSAGDTVVVKANESKLAKVAFLVSDNSADSTSPDFATGWSKAETVVAGYSTTFTAPSDAKFVTVLGKRVSGTPAGADHTPQSVKVNGVEVLAINMRHELYKELARTKALENSEAVALTFRQSVPTNTDLDTLYAAGIYLLFTNRTYTNLPPDILGGWLLVLDNGGAQQAQMLFELHDGSKWYRRRNSGVWSEWDSLSVTRDGSYIAFGDSITRGQTQAAKTPVVEYTIPDGIADACKLQVTNLGVSGQGFVKAANDETAIDAVQAADISGANLITIAYGRNDSSYQLGTASDEAGDNTICGQLKLVLNHITQTNKNAQVVVITPTPKTADGYTGATTGGWTLRGLEEAFKTICAGYHVPVVTWEDCTLTGRWGDFSTDGTHPNATAYKHLSSYMGGQVSKYFVNNQVL